MSESFLRFLWILRISKDFLVCVGISKDVAGFLGSLRTQEFLELLRIFHYVLGFLRVSRDF